MIQRTEGIYAENGFTRIGETPIDEWEAPWTDTEPVDANGRPLEPGQYVVRAIPGGRAVNIEVRCVREIKDGKVYLNNSKVRIEYPCRMLILDDWPPSTQTPG